MPVQLILGSLLAYSFYLLINKLDLIFFKRLMVQFVFILNFEKKLKALLHKKREKVPMENYETPEFYNHVWEAKVASINIFRIIECAIYFVSLSIGIVLISVYLSSIHKSLFMLVVLSALSSFLARIASGLNSSKSNSHLRALEKSEKINRDSLINPNYCKEIRAYSAFAYFNNIWKTSADNMQREKFKVERHNFKIESFFKLLNNIAILGSYILCVYLFLTQAIAYGEFMATVSASLIIQSVFSELFEDMAYFAEFSLLVRPFFNFMDTPDENKQKLVPNNICFEHIGYQYPNSKSDVLRDISFNMQKGEKILVVDFNGAGKSTLAKLIMGYLKPTMHNNDCSKNEILDRSAILQDYCRYSLNAVDNISLMQKNIDLEKIKDMAEALGVSAIIENDKILGKSFGESELSGGQWQRLALLRCWYRDKEIYIMDEPTSTIDPIHEQDINSFIMEKRQNKSLLLISHRLSLAPLVDKIFVLYNGEIVQQGSHKKLIEQAGLYKKLWESQSLCYGE